MASFVNICEKIVHIITIYHIVFGSRCWGCYPGVGVTKALFINFSVTGNLNSSKTYVRYFKLLSYLSDVSTAQLQWQLSNVNVIFYR